MHSLVNIRKWNKYQYFRLVRAPATLELLRFFFYQRGTLLFLISVANETVFFSSNERESLFLASKWVSKAGTKELIRITISSKATVILSVSIWKHDDSVSIWDSLTKQVACRIVYKIFRAGRMSSVLILVLAYDLIF